MVQSNSFGKEYRIRSSMSSYLKEIDAFPLLTREQECVLAESYGECCQPAVRLNAGAHLCADCARAKETLIVSNLRFVVSIAKKYRGSSLSMADLINEGNIGLILAADKFDHRRGFHFISYAVWWIRQSILKAISEKSRMIRLPMNRTNELLQINRTRDRHMKESGKNPNSEEIAEELGMDPTHVHKMLDCSRGHRSLDEYPEEDSSQPSTNPEEENSSSFLRDALVGIIRQLPAREEYIILKRYGLEDPNCQSLAQIGSALQLTKERVRQLEKQAIEHLRSLAEEKQIPLFM